MEHSIYMKTVCIKFASDRKDFVHLADKVEFFYHEKKYCFVLRVYRLSAVYDFIFDEIKSFLIY